MGTNGSKSGTGSSSPFGGTGAGPSKGADLTTNPSAGMKSPAGQGHDFTDPKEADFGAGGPQKTGPAASEHAQSIPAGGKFPFQSGVTEPAKGPSVGSTPSGSKAPFKVSSR